MSQNVNVTGLFSLKMQRPQFCELSAQIKKKLKYCCTYSSF